MCQARTIVPTGNTGLAELRAALFAAESLASFAITAAARPSVRKRASSISSTAGRTTTVGYGDFDLPDGRGKDGALSGARGCRKRSQRVETCGMRAVAPRQLSDPSDTADCFA
jgi:hypothetical protein